MHFLKINITNVSCKYSSYKTKQNYENRDLLQQICNLFAQSMSGLYDKALSKQ